MRVFNILAMIIATATTSMAIAQDDTEQNDFEMTRPAQIDLASPEVQNYTKPADPSQWPATLLFSSSITSGCTSTLVAKNAVLTAAHCVKDKSKGTLKAYGNDTSVRCTRNPSFATNATADYALCKLDNGIDATNFERINTSIAYPRVGDPVTLLGYGCTDSKQFSNINKVLYEGRTKISVMPSGANFDFITKEGSAVCFGDSGGAVYIKFQDGKRRIAALNRAVGVDVHENITNTSFLNSTSSQNFVDWAYTWGIENSVLLCGVHLGAVGCVP